MSRNAEPTRTDGYVLFQVVAGRVEQIGFEATRAEAEDLAESTVRGSGDARGYPTFVIAATRFANQEDE